MMMYYYYYVSYHDIMYVLMRLVFFGSSENAIETIAVWRVNAYGVDIT